MPGCTIYLHIKGRLHGDDIGLTQCTRYLRNAETPPTRNYFVHAQKRNSPMRNNIIDIIARWIGSASNFYGLA